MDIITINFKMINEQGLNLGNYFRLYYLYCLKTNPKLNSEFIKCHGPIDHTHAAFLQTQGYIKLGEEFDRGYELREKARIVFEGNKDYFYSFILTFPIKTPSGRYLSPKGENTVAGKKLRNKWKKLFGNDTLIQQRVINILQAEVDWRKLQGTQEYMHNAETWLNQGDWEKYEYLLEEKENKQKKQNEDFL